MTTTTHQATVPTPARQYFGPAADTREGHPIIEQVYRPESPNQGWRNHATRKRVSYSWLRKLRSEGVTHVALRCGSRLADFSIQELLASGSSWPGLGDSVGA